ncbi:MULTISPECIES: ester cyclase [Salinibaculum]|uniref:ester cyclase n=1 Tax=Salinibaculum TaxID=2732368 RepID=UPI0030CC9EAE
MAEASTTEHEQTLNTYQDYEDLWNGDFSKLDVVAESITFYNSSLPEGKLHGREAFEAYLRKLRSAFPDWYVVADDLLVDDGIVMKEWTITGTHEGEYKGIPPTGREFEIRGMDKILVADGKVQEARLYHNPQRVSEQLGLTED